MMKASVSAIAAVLLVSLAGAASAQALKPEEMIKFRKSGYSFMSWNMGKIKANLDGTFNKDQVAAAASVVAAVANSGNNLNLVNTTNSASVSNSSGISRSRCGRRGFCTAAASSRREAH